MNDADARGARKGSWAQDIPRIAADRVQQIRARIRDGAYATDEVLRATARAILERGDV